MPAPAPASELCVIGIEWACLSAGEWAAWVQAIGSFVALAIAIAIPKSIHKADRERIEEEKRMRGRSYALALLPFLEPYAARVRQAKWRLAQDDAHLELDEIYNSLELSVGLVERIREIHEIGPAANLLQDALASVPRLRTLVADHEFFLRNGGVYFDPEGREEVLEEPESFTPVIERVDRDMQAAVQAIRNLFT